MLIDAVKHYSTCESVGYIYIVWSEHRPPPNRAQIESLGNGKVQVYI